LQTVRDDGDGKARQASFNVAVRCSQIRKPKQKPKPKPKPTPKPTSTSPISSVRPTCSRSGRGCKNGFRRLTQPWWRQIGRGQLITVGLLRRTRSPLPPLFKNSHTSGADLSQNSKVLVAAYVACRAEGSCDQEACPFQSGLDLAQLVRARKNCGVHES